MISHARFIMLNMYHILVDGLFDTVPVILSFMALAYGSGETEVGLIVSFGAFAMAYPVGGGQAWVGIVPVLLMGKLHNTD